MGRIFSKFSSPTSNASSRMTTEKKPPLATVATGETYDHSYAEDDTVLALYDFEARSEGELSFKKYDHVQVVHVEDPEWIMARNLQTSEVGFIPSNLVALAGSLELFEWYFGAVNRREAESRLLRKSDGTFLIRDSFSNPGDFLLSVKHFSTDRKSPVRHYVIKFSNYVYSIGGKKYFRNLNELVEDYKVNRNGLPFLLKTVCQKVRPTITELSFETKDVWEIARSEISLIQQIGSGDFGDVYLGKWKNKIDVAVKTLKKGTMPDEQFLEEAPIMKGLKHENILSLLAVCSREEPIYIITPFMKQGSLLNVLQQCGETNALSFDQMLEFAFQISKGMHYLERKNLVHRDLAARNVLVDEKSTCKIAEFRLAKMLAEVRGHSISSGKFPVKWSPPEVFSEGKFSIKSDVWSFAIVMIEIFTYGAPLYPGMNQKQVKYEVARGYRLEQPELCPLPIYEVLLKCWDHNPNHRPFFKSLSKYLDDSLHEMTDGTQYLSEDEINM